MHNLDFAPLYRATVGFDRIADLMDRALAADMAQPTYPPYNIEKTADDAYRISIAVAGFTPDELSVEVKMAPCTSPPARRRKTQAAPTCTVASPPAPSNAVLPWPIMCASMVPATNTACCTSILSAKRPRL